MRKKINNNKLLIFYSIPHTILYKINDYLQLNISYYFLLFYILNNKVPMFLYINIRKIYYECDHNIEYLKRTGHCIDSHDKILN